MESGGPAVNLAADGWAELERVGPTPSAAQEDYGKGARSNNKMERKSLETESAVAENGQGSPYP